MRWTGLSCNWSPLNCRSLGNCPFFAPTVTTASAINLEEKKKFIPFPSPPLTSVVPTPLLYNKTPFPACTAAHINRFAYFPLRSRKPKPRLSPVEHRRFDIFLPYSRKMKETKKRGEKGGRLRPSLISLSSGSGIHPHRGEVRLPVDDRLPVLCLPSNAIQLLRPSFYIVKLVGRGFRSLIPLPRSVSSFLTSRSQTTICDFQGELRNIRNCFAEQIYFTATHFGIYTRGQEEGRERRLSNKRRRIHYFRCYKK